MVWCQSLWEVRSENLKNKNPKKEMSPGGKLKKKKQNTETESKKILGTGEKISPKAPNQYSQSIMLELILPESLLFSQEVNSIVLKKSRLVMQPMPGKRKCKCLVT